jgi:hypothetical protein
VGELGDGGVLDVDRVLLLAHLGHELRRVVAVVSRERTVGSRREQGR